MSREIYTDNPGDEDRRRRMHDACLTLDMRTSRIWTTSFRKCLHSFRGGMFSCSDLVIQLIRDAHVCYTCVAPWCIIRRDACARQLHEHSNIYWVTPWRVNPWSTQLQLYNNLESNAGDINHIIWIPSCHLYFVFRDEHLRYSPHF